LNREYLTKRKEIIDKLKTYENESTKRRRGRGEREEYGRKKEVKREYIGGCLIAFRGEEGRNKLRKATGIGKGEEIRRYPNGGTHHTEGMVPR
jgi:hypothetical protein